MTRSGIQRQRAGGVLLHPTSLPGPWGIGGIGRDARDWVDWLADAGQSYWQILPLVATDQGGSPYNGLSALAGSPLLIDPHDLAADGLLSPEELETPALPGGEVDFARALELKESLLRRAHEAYRTGAAPALQAPFAEYRSRHASWLDDYALFRALREENGGAPWTEWEAPLRDRDPAALRQARERLAAETERHQLDQFLFDRQWRALREHAHSRGVRIIGDIPIFVAHDSADVWAHRELFELDEQGRPEVVSGVPPDYFSETGQRWGNPLYRWGRMRERGYQWWTERFRRTLEWVDLVRVDHFRGFEAYWEIPAEEETALNGEWQPGPGRDLFDELADILGPLPVIAEDLGLITDEVEELRDELGFPGMRVLQFAFDGDPRNPHLPENHVENVVAYTGTHDNDTTVGWWEDASAEDRARVRERLDDPGRPIHEALLEMVLRSPAALAVVPMQDVLGLGGEARMNTPGTAGGNWRWRLREGQLDPRAGARLREMTERARRLAAPAAQAKSNPSGRR